MTPGMQRLTTEVTRSIALHGRAITLIAAAAAGETSDADLDALRAQLLTSNDALESTIIAAETPPPPQA